MAISIDENVLLFLTGAIFIPLIVFMVKLVVDVGIIKGSLGTMQKQIDRLEERGDNGTESGSSRSLRR